MATIPQPKKKTPEELHKELEKIYTDGEGQLPDFTRLDGKPSGRLKPLLIGLLSFFAFLAVVTWAGFFLFLKPSGFTGEGVEVTMTSSSASSTAIMAGGDATVVVAYANREDSPLASGVLSVEMPEGFVLVSSEPAAAEDGTWAIGSVAAGGSGHVILHGWARQAPESTLTFQAKLAYRPSDFNSQFQRTSSHTTAVEGSVLTHSASTTDEMTPGDEIELVYAYENTSDRKFDDLRFVIDAPDTFIISDTVPKTDETYADRWSIASLEPKAKGEIKVKGTFSTSARGPQSVPGRIGFVSDDALLAAAATTANTTVKKSDLAMDLIINGSDKAPAVSFADTLHLTLVYKNTGDVALQDVSVSIQLPSEPAGIDLIDWVTLKDDLAGVRKGAVLTWTKEQIPELAELKPDAGGEIDVSVQLVKQPVAGAKSSRYAVNAQAVAQIGKAGKTVLNRVVAGTPVAILLNSDASFRAMARYYDESGAPLGSGPMPPRAGEKTVYRVVWTVANTLHELSNLSVSTVLPEGVKWTGNQQPIEAGELKFDETGRRAEWRLNRLPTSVKTLTVAFDVEASPTSSDIGSIMDLTGDMRFEALDKETQNVILKSAMPLGTDLLGDQHASGKGVVVE